jgi:hypothetical protein
MSDEERQDVTIGSPSASAGAEPVGQDDDNGGKDDE